MTDNQFNQLFGIVTKSVEGIQRLEKDVTGLKEDVSGLKAGQTRIEKEMKLMHKNILILSRDSMEVRTKIEVLEDRIEMSN